MLGRQPGAGSDHLGSGPNVLAGAPDVGPGLGVERDDDRLALARADLLDHDRIGAGSGAGAPVKMRAAVPGSSGAPSIPAGMR